MGRDGLIALTVPRGLDKPCFDNNGVIWLKTGADKRDLPVTDDEMTTLLRNLNLALPSGQLNLASDV